MSSKNQVTLDFAGDTTKLEKAFSTVGASANTMTTKVSEASSKIDGFGETTDKIASKTGVATGAFGALNSGVDLLNAKSEARKQKLASENEQISAQVTKLSSQKDATGKLSAGVQDQIDKLNGQVAANNQSTASIDKSEAKTQSWTNALTAAGFAFDSVSGAADLLHLATESGTIKTITNTASLIGNTTATIATSVAQKTAAVASKVWAGAQWLLNAAMDANPVALIVIGIVALIAIVVVIATKTTWFQTLWKAAWGGIKTAALDVWNWMKGFPGMLVTAMKDVGNIILAPYKFAFNMIADVWNNTVGKLSFHIPSWVPGIGGDGFSMPKIPKFHSGGIIPGAPGSEMLAILQAGERVTPAGGGGSGGSATVYAGDAVTAAVVAAIRDVIATRFGGDVSVFLAGTR